MTLKLKPEGMTTMKRLGWPYLMSNRDCRALKKVARETCQTFTNCLASTMTVHWELRGMGFHGQTDANKPNISPMNAKSCLTWYKSNATGQWTIGNVWFGVMNHAIPCGDPMGGFGCGECPENDTCQHVYCQQWNLEEVALRCEGVFHGMDLAF
jgi:hypothetical protein